VNIRLHCNGTCLYIMAYGATGGKLVYHYKKKLGSVPKCGDCKVKLHGVRLVISCCYFFLTDALNSCLAVMNF